MSTLITNLLRVADDRLILGHRISEWCGHGPMLEEDIALSNIALDLIGQASTFYTHAGSIEGKSEDDYAYKRAPNEFLNIQLVEQPRGDFAETIARLFLFDSFDILFLSELSKSKDKNVSSLAQRAEKEIRYHLRHSSQWIIRLGDGTEESHERIQKALDKYWPMTDEFFITDEIDLVKKDSLKRAWLNSVKETLTAATLSLPSGVSSEPLQGRSGIHTEHLETLLADMQFLPRKYPDAVW